MKFASLAVFLAVISAMTLSARAEESASAPKAAAVDVTPPVAEQATQGLFERVRGAYLRAVQHGNVALNAEHGQVAAPVKQ